MTEQRPAIRSPSQKIGLVLLVAFAIFHFFAMIWSAIPKNPWYTEDIKTVIQPLKEAEHYLIGKKKELSGILFFQILSQYTRFFRLEQNWGFFGGNFEPRNSSIGVRVLTASIENPSPQWRWLYLEPSFNISDVQIEPSMKRFSLFEPKLATDVIDNLNKRPTLAELLLNYHLNRFRQSRNHKVLKAETVLLTWSYSEFQDITSVKASEASEKVLYAISSP